MQSLSIRKSLTWAIMRYFGHWPSIIWCVSFLVPLFLICSLENFFGWQFCQVFWPLAGIGYWESGEKVNRRKDGPYLKGLKRAIYQKITKFGRATFFCWNRFPFGEEEKMVGNSGFQHKARWIREELRAHFIGRGEPTIGAQYPSYVSTHPIQTNLISWFVAPLKEIVCSKESW